MSKQEPKDFRKHANTFWLTDAENKEFNKYLDAFEIKPKKSDVLRKALFDYIRRT
jgi:hypothetical protein